MEKTKIFKDIYYRMLLTRFLEEGLIKESKKGNTYGPLHLCIGQEAAGVASCAALRPADVVCTTHRGHAHYLGKGIDLRRLCCEIFGKKEGYGKGRAGHMIIWDRETGVLGGSGIVGGGLPIAAGQALAFQMKSLDNIVLACFGDGASNTGAFHESLNMAAKWKLPVLFFCETNQYGLTVHVDDHLSVENVVERSIAYGMEGKSVFGNDFEAVYETVSAAVEKVRVGSGPLLIEAKTYRMTGFSTGDTGGYQRPEEMEDWKDKDPIDMAEKTLTDKGIYTAEDMAEKRDLVHKEVRDAIEYGKNAVGPDQIVIPDDIYEGAI